MKLLLVLPRPYAGYRSTRSVGKRPLTPPLNLPYLAALTPEDIEVEIVDECVEAIDFEKSVDLVGISVLTMAAPRAYEIARVFRERGVRVVLGGIHPTLLPEEAGRHADAIVVGEAEGVWQQLLMDFRKGRMRRVYRRSDRPVLENLPTPRWDLVKKSAYVTTNVVQSSRGCPYRCNFCSIWRTFGKTYRHRPISDVIGEIRSFRGKLVGFADADVAGNPAYAEALFRALEPCGKYWVSDAGIRIAKHDRLLELAAKSGCKVLYIGFESLSRDGLKDAGKTQNLAMSYRDLIDRMHQHGIMVGAGFIFGLDTDGKDVFERTVAFAIDSRVDMADFHVVCPYPDTEIFARFQSEGRILETDWSKYSKYNVVYRPKRMSPEELQEGCYWAWKQFYATHSILRRMLSPHVFVPWTNALPYLLVNATLNREASQYE